MGKKAAQKQEPEELSGEPQGELEALRLERDKYLTSWQRAQADYQNLKRRTLADIDAATRRAQQPLLEEMLLVLDHLDMAVAIECSTDEAKSVLTGVQLTRGQVVGVLERQGVRAIPTDGIFDPTLHQAVATIDTPDHEPGQILEVLRTGWTLGDQVLRFAQVKVAAAPTDEGQDED